MYHWNRFKKLILGHGRGASLLASPRPASSRVPSRRARQAEPTRGTSGIKVSRQMDAEIGARDAALGD